MAGGGVGEVIASYESYGLHVSDAAKNLLCKMLHADSSKRPTLREILQHPFLRRSPNTRSNYVHAAGTLRSIKAISSSSTIG